MICDELKTDPGNDVTPSGFVPGKENAGCGTKDEEGEERRAIVLAT